MAMHRLPGGHDVVPWRLVVALGAFTLSVCGLGSWATLQAWNMNALWWLPVAPVLMALGMRYIAGRGGGGFVPSPEGVDLDDSPTISMAPVEAGPADPGRRPGDHSIGRDLDRPAARHSLNEETAQMTEPKPSPVPRPEAPRDSHYPALDPDRFAPFTIEQIDSAALGIQTSRWNHTRFKKMQPSEAALGFKTMNRYLKEEVYKQAFAALQTVSLPSPDEILVDFWHHKMEVLIDWFNPPDEDAACESICLDAIERAYKFAESQPCTCAEDDVTADDPYAACPRCQVLGRVRDVAVQR